MPHYTADRHVSLSWAISIQSTPYHIKNHFNIILPSTPRFCKCSSSFTFPCPNSAYVPPYVLHAPPISSSMIWHPNNNRWGVQTTTLLIKQFSPVSSQFIPLGSNIFVRSKFTKDITFYTEFCYWQVRKSPQSEKLMPLSRNDNKQGKPVTKVNMEAKVIIVSHW